MKSKFEIWKTIKVGTYKKVWELCSALEKSGFSINTDARYILGVGGHEFLGKTIFCESPFILEVTEERIHLVKVSVADLGFKNGATYGDICNKAKEFGLELCPNEVGPQLRLQCNDQLEMLLYVAIKPIIDFDGSQNIFELVSHGGHLWIDMRSTSRFYGLWRADECFVFCLP